MVSSRQILARKGEDLAEGYFRRRKYNILARNYRCRVGEADLILQKGKTIIFVEVKTRTSRAFGEPEEAINHHKKQKLYQIAQYYLMEKGLPPLDVQFDVVSVILSQGSGKGEILHFENALNF